ncbi:death-associated protein kinase 1-like [Branchiostoma floridae]|uniref:non-specific serine/threonine protein kinase n=1 Tax=Branchiostoma floridae TaxID=7739 RepID=A0A9J7KKV5_BRAFL|nr:death-associated protein kinase 1-like [Branchiostoma floridae]
MKRLRKYGDTGLHYACSGGHDKIVEQLIKNGTDLNVTNGDGNTGLHYACGGGHYNVVELLIKNGADLNVTNKGRDTGLHYACKGGHYKVVELLIKNGADLTVTNKNGDTGLHKACEGDHDKVVELLIKNGVNLNMTNVNGDTGLYYACAGGHDKVVELLIKNGAYLNVTNEGGWTGLHKACWGGHDKVVELLIKNGADLNVTNKYGDTGLHKACREGHDKVVELLIENGVDLTVTNKNGDTGLHKACERAHDKVVELLIKNRADLNVTNKNNKRPVDVTAGLGKDTQLLLETETRKQAEYSELVSSVGSEEGTTVKLFLCGDGQVGKTSLRKILKKTGVIVVAFWNIKRRVRQQDVFNPTPGVHVSSKTVPGIGRLSLHDFAGQAQFYVTHAMLLRTTNAIFPVVYKITDGEDEQKRQVHGWLSFIHCSNADPTNKPRIILIASHADKLQDQEAGMRRAKALVEHYRKLFQESLIVSQEVFLINCLEAGSPGIQRLREVLAAFRDDMLKQRPQVPKVCVQILTLIESRRQERKMFPVMEWQDFLTAVRQATYGTLESRIVHLASSYLHDEGEIIYLRREADSSVVLDPKWLFTSVLGSLLAPDNFPIDKVERTADDYVTVEELKRVFSAVADIPLLIKLLQDFQLCHTYNGRTFILPSLLQQEMEEAAWSPVSSKAVYFGLQIQGRQEIDSFSCDLFPRLQTLLMQAHPDKLSRPLLWKNSAKCTDGKADALLRITQDKRQLNIFVRSTKGFRKDCNSIMDLLKNMTYRLLHETSPGSRSRDMVLSALDLREHRPQPHAYSREEVETAAEEGRDVVHPKRNIPEDVKDLLLHLDSLTGMLGRVARKRPELVETLRHINPILNHLRADDVINLDENDRIRAARTPQDAARELLDILEAKGERACVKFHSVLETCDKFAASLIVEEEMSEEGATAS